jgi:hypothetical protein
MGPEPVGRPAHKDDANKAGLRVRSGEPRCDGMADLGARQRRSQLDYRLHRDGARREGLAVDRNSQFTHSLAGLHQPSFGVGLCLKTRNAQATLQNREPTVS